MRLRPCLLSCLLICACAGDPAAEDSAAAGESAPSTAPDDWGNLEEDDTQPNTEQGAEQGVDPEGRACISLFQDCGQGYKCVPYWVPQDLTGPPTDYKCVPVEGELPAGSSCTLTSLESGLDDCDQDSFCWTWVEALPGRCHPLCTGGFQYADCSEGWNCALPDDAPPMCVELCDPFADACPSGTQCALSGYGPSCVVANPEPGLPQGAACELLNECAAGLHCAPASDLPACAGERCCTSLCHVDAGDAPCQALDPSYTCLPWLIDPDETLGWCGLST